MTFEEYIAALEAHHLIERVRWRSERSANGWYAEVQAGYPQHEPRWPGRAATEDEALIEAAKDALGYWSWS